MRWDQAGARGILACAHLQNRLKLLHSGRCAQCDLCKRLLEMVPLIDEARNAAFYFLHLRMAADWRPVSVPPMQPGPLSLESEHMAQRQPWCPTQEKASAEKYLHRVSSPHHAINILYKLDK